METPIVSIQSAISCIEEVWLNNGTPLIEREASCREQRTGEPGTGRLGLTVFRISAPSHFRNTDASDEQAKKDLERLSSQTSRMVGHVNQMFSTSTGNSAVQNIDVVLEGKKEDVYLNGEVIFGLPNLEAVGSGHRRGIRLPPLPVSILVSG